MWKCTSVWQDIHLETVISISVLREMTLREVFWLLPGYLRWVRSESLYEWTCISEPADRWHTAALPSQHTFVRTGRRSGSWRCNRAETWFIVKILCVKTVKSTFHIISITCSTHFYKQTDKKVFLRACSNCLIFLLSRFYTHAWWM